MIEFYFVHLGDTSSIENMIGNISKCIPTIILKVIIWWSKFEFFFLNHICISKGTGLIANQIAALYESMNNIRDGTSNEPILSEIDLHRLTDMSDNARSLVLVCQPGKDELDESILRAIGIGE